jgi:hypothetical protein
MEESGYKGSGDRSRGDVEDRFSSVGEEARTQASAATDAVKESARDAAEQRKRAGRDQIGGVADAAEAAANELQGKMPQAAEYIRGVAGQLDTLASTMRERSVDDLIAQTADFARKQPVAFFAGTVAVGFALSRFLKSSASRQS